MSKQPIAAALTQRKLSVAERRAFIWASPRIHSKGCPGPYYLASRSPTEAEPLTDADITVERSGVKDAFDYLYGHANMERAKYGFWAVGHRANKTRRIFDDMHEAAAYAEVLRGICLAEAVVEHAFEDRGRNRTARKVPTVAACTSLQDFFSFG